ncbi:MAG: FtsQ-type POTRA domain-containing protein [Candidatus Binatia bacterium]
MTTSKRQVTMRGRHKADGRKRRGLVRLVWSIAAVLFTSTLFFYVDWHQVSRIAGQLRDYLLQHSYFSVQEIRVIGGRRVGGSEIVAMTRLRRGMKIWKIDSKGIEAKVSRHPWVRRVIVRREFPRRVVIQIEEWVAKGIVVFGELYYVNAEGFIFKKITEGETVNYPLITGLRRADIESHVYSDRQRIAKALRLSDLFGENSITISEFHFDSHRGVVVYPVSYPVALHMDWGEWPEKVRRLKRVLSMWRGKVGRLAWVDLSFSGQVVVRLREKIPLSGKQPLINQT